MCLEGHHPGQVSCWAQEFLEGDEASVRSVQAVQGSTVPTKPSLVLPNPTRCTKPPWSPYQVGLKPYKSHWIYCTANWHCPSQWPALVQMRFSFWLTICFQCHMWHPKKLQHSGLFNEFLSLHISGNISTAANTINSFHTGVCYTATRIGSSDGSFLLCWEFRTNSARFYASLEIYNYFAIVSFWKPISHG